MPKYILIGSKKQIINYLLEKDYIDVSLSAINNPFEKQLDTIVEKHNGQALLFYLKTELVDVDFADGIPKMNIFLKSQAVKVVDNSTFKKVKLICKLNRD